MSFIQRILETLNLAGRRAPRLLMVADSPSMPQALRNVLQQAGWESKIVRDAAQAAREIGNNSFDLVAVDLASPASGLEAIQELHSIAPTVGVLDGLNPEVEHLAFQAGSVGCLHRPCSARSLMIALQDFVLAMPA